LANLDTISRADAYAVVNRAAHHFDNVYWITFAGMATTTDPRYVVGVMMDNPARNADGSPGHSAAPLFHNIAGWLLQSRAAAGLAGDLVRRHAYSPTPSAVVSTRR
jgi:cell division protein FtsI/penicillin-binding protein 2